MFGRIFDFNQDGKTDAIEFGIAMSILDDIEEDVDAEEESKDEE